VRSIKDSDSRLQAVLKPEPGMLNSALFDKTVLTIEPDDLNSLYVYEAKMSLFIRMAQSRAGAERLLDAQLLPILSQCDYLDTRPEADQSFIGMFAVYSTATVLPKETYMGFNQTRTRSYPRRFNAITSFSCLLYKLSMVCSQPWGVDIRRRQIRYSAFFIEDTVRLM